MTKHNDFIWKAIQTICWFIFAGFCVQTGALLFNYIYSLFRPIATENLHLGLNLSELYKKSISIYTLLFTIIIGLSVMKALVFYTVIRIFKKLNLVKPFSNDVYQFILKITYYAFSIGVISLISQKIAERLIDQGYEIGIIERYWNDYLAYLMMAAILFVIALIFKKGIELQSENDLTV
ncbi:MAG: DUF2975 domain-containing protein [Cyclobacteriaceae bacterium]|nr:DUF2975 domain-containing protein [Cyclobacteriaceae bacterium]